MTHGRRAREGASPGLVVEIDAGARGADIHVMAAVAWPHDEQRRRQWLAALSGLALHRLAQPKPEIREALQDAAERQAGESGQDAAATLSAASAAVEAYIRGTLFDPAGGLETLVEAPAMRALLGEADENRRLGLLAGEALFILAVMTVHHPELPPSLNRAMAVMEAHPGRQPYRNERMLKEVWPQWRAVAPFWAARLALAAALGADPNKPRPPAPTAEKRAEWLRAVLGLTEGFRQFAARYKPARGQGPLIPEGEAVEFRAGVPVITPMLKPLQPALLETARGYKVRAIRQ
jgi:hypothetical protein